MKDPPEFCICGAPRTGIQEGRAYFACGSRATEWWQKLKLERSPKCFERTRVSGNIQTLDKRGNDAKM